MKDITFLKYEFVNDMRKFGFKNYYEKTLMVVRW